MLNTIELKQQAATAAVKYLKPDMVLGVGTGSTVRALIEQLGHYRHWFSAVVASSEATEALLKDQGIQTVDLNTVEVDLYIDGTDEIDPYFQLIKGGGAALTREKILAAASKQFLVIADESKQVKRLGENCPIPVEVIPMARSYVARQIVKLGGDPFYREKCVTDNGHVILDVHNLKMLDVIATDHQINQIPGVVGHGLFCHQTADIAIIATKDGVKTLNKEQLAFNFMEE